MKRLALTLVALSALPVVPVAAADVDRRRFDSSLEGCWDLIPSAKLQERLNDGRQSYSHRRCFDRATPGLSRWKTCDGLNSMVGPTSVHCYDDADHYDIESGRLVITRTDNTFAMMCAVEIFDEMLTLSDCVGWDPSIGGATRLPLPGESYGRVQP